MTRQSDRRLAQGQASEAPVTVGDSVDQQLAARMAYWSPEQVRAHIGEEAWARLMVQAEREAGEPGDVATASTLGGDRLAEGQQRLPDLQPGVAEDVGSSPTNQPASHPAFEELVRLFFDPKQATACADRGGNGFQVSRYGIAKLREFLADPASETWGAVEKQVKELRAAVAERRQRIRDGWNVSFDRESGHELWFIDDPELPDPVVVADRAGFERGVRLYAWWKDGVEYVGTCGKTLKEALDG